MSSTVTYKCPNCGAGLLFDAESQKFACEFCLSAFAESELDTEAQTLEREQEEKETQEFSEEVNAYICNSCGAEILADKSTVADFCYYCHNPIVIEARVSGMQRPAKIIPFKFSKEEAVDAFLRFAKKKKFVPKDYFSPEQTDKIKGVYYPFFVVDAETQATLTATGKKLRSWRAGDYRYTETSVFDVERSGEIRFEDVTTAAISTEDRNMLEGILPFPKEDPIDFKMPYLQGFVAKARDLEREQLSQGVRQRMTGYAEGLLSSTVRGYSSVSGKRTELKISSSKWDYTLMPIWILNYHRKGKKYTYAMNGSTGKIYGELPISPSRLAIFAGIISAVSAALAFLIGWGLG